ncbi:MAG: ATP-grasp domain-containing protein [Mogibacterium sp.]|nr:ATP-grasp domain-containing protein [Mogibacterium sp.]
MDKIMILGASVYQVPLIRTAKKMGLYTIVASIPGNYPGFSDADEICHINTTDKEAILEVCEREKISGICTSGTDVAVATIGYVNEHMGLAGISEQAAENACDKSAMKEAFKRGGVAASEFLKVCSYDEACDAADKIGYPVVVKCVDSSGSRGINVVNDRSGLKEAYEEAVRYSRKDYVLIEEKLSGTEIGVDGMIQGGEILLIAPHRKYTYTLNGATMPAGHSFPYYCTDDVRREIEKQITLAVRALGLDNCAFNSDVFVDGDNVYIIEMGGRAGATGIPELISIHYGFDFYEKMIENALGRKVDLGRCSSRTKCMSRLLMSPVDGRITAIDEDRLDELRSRGNEIRTDYGPGSEVEHMYNGTTRIGDVITKTDDGPETDALLREIYSAIFVNGRSLEELWEG